MRGNPVLGKRFLFIGEIISERPAVVVLQLSCRTECNILWHSETVSSVRFVIRRLQV